MHLSISGTPDNATKHECRLAFKYVAKELLSDRLSNNIKLRVKFIPQKELKDCGGWCDFVDRNHLPREYEIAIAKNWNREGLFQIIAHEMTHLKQFAVGQMKDLKGYRKGEVKWGKRYYKERQNPEEKGYTKQPWEKEAMKNQIIGTRFLESIS